MDVSGTFAGALICFATLLAGGLGWLAVIVSFVLISSLLTRFRFDYKQKIDSAQEKDGQRSGRTRLQTVWSAGLRHLGTCNPSGNLRGCLSGIYGGGNE